MTSENENEAIRAADKIFRDAEKLIIESAKGVARYYDTNSVESDMQARDARLNLLPLMNQATALEDIALLLSIEQVFLETEVEYLIRIESGRSVRRTAIWELKSVMTMLDHVRDPDKYKQVALYYNLANDVSHNRLPRDAARRFFASHWVRLGKVRSWPSFDKSKNDLYKARLDHIRLARILYMELQRQVMSLPDVVSVLPAPPPHEYRDPADYIHAWEVKSVA